MIDRSKVILVDNHDLIIGESDKLAAHEQGLLHRAFSIFVFAYNTEGLQVLLHQRAVNKYHAARLWTNTCCSHPQPNENIQNALAERLHTEMGIKATNFTYAGQFKYKVEFSNGLIEHEIDHVYSVMVNQSTSIHPNENEVMDYRWINEHICKTWLHNSPSTFTPWFEQAFTMALTHTKREKHYDQHHTV